MLVKMQIQIKVCKKYRYVHTKGFQIVIVFAKVLYISGGF